MFPVYIFLIILILLIFLGIWHYFNIFNNFIIGLLQQPKQKQIKGDLSSSTSKCLIYYKYIFFLFIKNSSYPTLKSLVRVRSCVLYLHRIWYPLPWLVTSFLNNNFSNLIGLFYCFTYNKLLKHGRFFN